LRGPRCVAAALWLVAGGAPAARACSPGDWSAADFEAAQGLAAGAQPLALAGGSTDAGAAEATASAPVPAWSNASPVVLARQEVAVAELDGLVYVVGGIDGTPSFLSSVEVYDPSDDTWSAAPALPTPLHHTTATAVDGKLYVIGGWADFFQTPLDVVYELDPAQGSWTPKSPMPTPRGSPAAAALDGRIYVAGGWPTANARDFAVYDPATDAWQTLPDLPSGRNHLGLAAADGRIFAVGGRTDLQAGVGNVADVDVYDPASGTWSTAAPLPRARGGIASVGAGRWVFAFGGEGNAASPDGTFPDADVYDALGDTWSALPPMPTPRHGIGAAVVDGQVHVPAGGPVENFSVSAVHEVLDATSLLASAVPGLGWGALGLTALLFGAASQWAAGRSPQRPRAKPD